MAGRGALLTPALLDLLTAVALLLAGCESPAPGTAGDSASAGVAGTVYRKVLLLPPNEDEHAVVPRVVAGLEAMGFAVSVVDAASVRGPAQGTGFVSEGTVIRAMLAEFRKGLEARRPRPASAAASR